MESFNITLLALPNGELGLPSVFKNQQDEPRFIIPLPNSEHFIKNDPGLSYMVVHEMQKGGFEYATRRFFYDHIQPGDGFIDIGAHWGIFSLTVASRYLSQKAVDDVEVLAIEAHPFNAMRLIQSVTYNGMANCIEVISSAMGEKARTVRLVGGLGTMGHSVNGAGWSGERSSNQPPSQCPRYHLIAFSQNARLLPKRDCS